MRKLCESVFMLSVIAIASLCLTTIWGVIFGDGPQEWAVHGIFVAALALVASSIINDFSR